MVAAHFGELVIFRQEAVPRVDRVHPAGGGSGEDVGDVEIALAAQGIADADVDDYEADYVAIDDDGFDSEDEE